tara:strand:- start:1146 stop:1397 length:252 start_codon:yes stop_codon:yes gene_type:complete
MNISELCFEAVIESSSNLELIDEFFEVIEEPLPTGRIYKGAKYYTEFGISERKDKTMTEIVSKDDNHLVGFESDHKGYYSVRN